MPQKIINILIIPAGSRLALGAIKFLKKEKNIRIISADCDKLAPGFYLSDKSYLISSFLNEPSFFRDIKKIIKKEKIDIIIPGLDPVLLKFSENKEFFEKLKTKVLISPPETISLTRDKWQTYKFLKDIIPFPKSFIDKDKVNISYPLFIKPRDGSGSADAFKINSKEELYFYSKRIENIIIQEYLDGQEYTVDCLADMDGNLLSCVPRLRLGTKAGVSIKGKIVKNKDIENIAKKISGKLKFNGPFLFQLKEKKGKLMVLEINTRFGGGMPLSVMSGPNIYLLSVKLFLGQKIGKMPKIKYGLYFTRHDQEIYLTEKEIKSKIYKI
jgi:carbamoyl-phosphate synthase large subunit